MMFKLKRKKRLIKGGVQKKIKTPVVLTWEDLRYKTAREKEETIKKVLWIWEGTHIYRWWRRRRLMAVGGEFEHPKDEIQETTEMVSPLTRK